MSFTFDVMQQGVAWLDEQVEGNNQAADVVYYLKKIIDDLHDYSHRENNILNRLAGVNPELLATALRYEDDEERSMWLKLKGQV